MNLQEYQISQDVIDFCKLHNRLYDHAFNAKNYLYLLEMLDGEQYEMSRRYFSCCYTIVHNSLIESLQLNIIRLYDLSSPSMETLLNLAQKVYHQQDKNTIIFNEYQHTCYDENFGQINIPYTYFISTFDRESKHLIDKIQQADNEIIDEKRWAEILEHKWIQHEPKTQCSAKELLIHLQKIIISKKDVIQRLKEQRNNLLIHNDPEYLDETKERELHQQYPLYKKDIKDLTLIAFNSIMWLERMLNKDNLPSGLSIPKGTQYHNQRDVEYLLNLIQAEVDKQEKESHKLEEELRGNPK